MSAKGEWVMNVYVVIEEWGHPDDREYDVAVVYECGEDAERDVDDFNAESLFVKRRIFEAELIKCRCEEGEP